MFMCIYVVGDYIWLCAYMLLVVIYVMCIYVVGSYILTCCVWLFLWKWVQNGEFWFWWIGVNWWCCCVDLRWMNFLFWIISFGYWVVWEKIESWVKSRLKHFCEINTSQHELFNHSAKFECMLWGKIYLFILSVVPLESKLRST